MIKQPVKPLLYKKTNASHHIDHKHDDKNQKGHRGKITLSCSSHGNRQIKLVGKGVCQKKKQKNTSNTHKQHRRYRKSALSFFIKA